MAKTISIHSFRGGTGKTNTTANLAVLMSSMGKRVGVIDTDIQSPGIHILFSRHEEEPRHYLNDYLWGRCSITEAAWELPDPSKTSPAGTIFLVPSNTRGSEITRVLREGYSVELLTDSFRDLIDGLDLDVLLIDTHPGLNEETLLAIAISDVLVIVMRPDQQDYLGTGVTIDVARRLEVPRLTMVVNKVPEDFNTDEVMANVAETYGCEVAGVLPHSTEMMHLASYGLFVIEHPRHPVTAVYRQIATSLLA